MYFQVQFMKVQSTEHAKNAIKSSLKKERLLARWERGLNARKKYHDDPEKKRKEVRERYYDKKETIKQYKKEKHHEN